MYLHKEQKCAKRDLCSKTGGGANHECANKCVHVAGCVPRQRAKHEAGQRVPVGKKSVGAKPEPQEMRV